MAIFADTLGMSDGFWQAAFTCLGLVVVAWMQQRNAKASADREAKVAARVEDVRTELRANTVTTVATKEKLGDVHGIVNGQREQMVRQIAALQAEVAELKRVSS